jgi:hypothetical protein
MNTINYKYISNSIEHYVNNGYNYIEVPWYVTKDVMNVTKPLNINIDDDYYIPKNNKFLVASAEQSFIYLIFKGIITPGYYVGVTPCFRFEKITDTHRKVFMKVELIYISENMNEDLNKPLDKIILDAKTFFEETLGHTTDLIEVHQENSIINYDINYKNYELGSYGIRKHKNLFHWVYGTGCAEPRLSLIEKM